MHGNRSVGSVLLDADAVQNNIPGVRDHQGTLTPYSDSVPKQQIGMATGAIGGPHNMLAVDRCDVLQVDVDVGSTVSFVILNVHGVNTIRRVNVPDR